jgi:hypothetical protein
MSKPAVGMSANAAIEVGTPQTIVTPKASTVFQ